MTQVLLRIGLAPRMLNEGQAAAYCGLTIDLFKSECPVIPTKLRNRVRYDRVLIDRWLDQRGGSLPELDPQQWLGKLDDGADASKGH